jgi:hypothetical protein
LRDSREPKSARTPMLSRRPSGRLRADPTFEGGLLTLVWFIVWLIANNIGDSEPLLFDPVNWWAGALLLAAALDLSRQHIRPVREH